MNGVTGDKTFKKHYALRIANNAKLNRKFEERVTLFINNPRSRLLNGHALQGSKLGLRAFSVTGDVRVVYKQYEDTCVFLDVGSHNQVY